MSIAQLLVQCFFPIHVLSLNVFLFLPTCLPKTICLLIAFITDELYFCLPRSMSGGLQGLIHASVFILVIQLGLGDEVFFLWWSLTAPLINESKMFWWLQHLYQSGFWLQSLALRYGPRFRLAGRKHVSVVCFVYSFSNGCMQILVYVCGGS